MSKQSQFRLAATILAVFAVAGLYLPLVADDSVSVDVADETAALDRYYNGAVEPTMENLSDEERVAHLLREAKTVDLKSLPSLPVERFALPHAGVDLMRARVEETYEIYGIGTDTVTLTGWIAVKHENPRLAEGQETLRWGTAVIATEFLGMDLRGESEVFGPVRVILNPEQPSVGEVGAVAVLDLTDDPDHLISELQSRAVAKLASTQTEPPQPEEPAKPKIRRKTCAAKCDCQATIAALVQLEDLDMTLATKYPVLMKSEVETIPPVGYTATVSLLPTPLVYAGRDVGVLQHAEVKFREIVRHVALEGRVF
jgi:hypothetical protein